MEWGQWQGSPHCRGDPSPRQERVDPSVSRMVLPEGVDTRGHGHNAGGTGEDCGGQAGGCQHYSMGMDTDDDNADEAADKVDHDMDDAGVPFWMREAEGKKIGMKDWVWPLPNK